MTNFLNRSIIKPDGRVENKDRDTTENFPLKLKRITTPAQLIQRAKFKLIIGFMSPLQSITRKYFGENEDPKVRISKSISYQLKEAIDEKDGVLELNYSKIVITKGVLFPVLVRKSIIKNNQLKLTWVANSGDGLSKATDRVTVIMYSQRKSLFYIVDGEANRGDEVLIATIPNGWLARDNSVWLYFVDADNKHCSTSIYLGKL